MKFGRQQGGENMEGVGEGEDDDQSIRYENKLISWTVVAQSFNPRTWKPEAMDL